jgi:hypothetical protein
MTDLITEARELCELRRKQKHIPMSMLDIMLELCDALEKAQAEIERLREFKAYFDELYGQGLDVMNGHLNGSAELFDSFFDSALEQMNQLLPAPPEEGAEHERD